jgi:uncharacterized membrane protein HdeD (DUF308 family)
MIVLGVIVLLIGVFAEKAIVWKVGLGLILVGVILAVSGHLAY